MVIHYKTDILIIGSGGAGLRAAIEAEAKGAKVTIVSKSAAGMKTASVVTNGFFRAAVGEVTKEQHKQATLEGGKHINDEKLVDIMVEEGPEKIMELQEYGVALQTLNGMVSCGDNPQARGIGFIQPLIDYVKSKNVELVDNCLITKLIKKDGKVIGAAGYQKEPVVFSAKAVILAAGGSGALYPRTDCPLTLTGDGYALAYEAGAILRDMEFVQFLPIGLAEEGFPPLPIYGPTVEEGKIMNVDGEDLVKKHKITKRPLATMSRDLLSRAIMREVEEGKGVDGAALIDATAVVKEHGMDKLWRSQSHRSVMEKVGIAEKPFKVAPLLHFCMAGVNITENGETNLPGLFAAGEVTGGVHGANRIDGNAMTEIIVFGARSGAAAAEYVANEELVEAVELAQSEIDSYETLKNDSGYKDLKEKLREIMWTKVGVVRSKEKLDTAIQEIRALREDNEKQGSNDTEELKNILQTSLALTAAELTATSAAYRRESRGTHFRTDYPESSDKWLRPVYIRKAKHGMFASVSNL